MSYLQEPKTMANYRLGVPPDFKTSCPVCKQKEARIFFNANPSIRLNQVFPCNECQDKRDKENIEVRRWYDKNARGVFKNDETGQEMVLDQRGNPMENPYSNREIDPHGWLHTNKKDYKKSLESKNIL